VFVTLAYAPFLLLLPLLLIAGLVFVVVPGGFIVVLIGLYYLAMAGLSYAFAGLISLAGLATSRRRQARRPSTSSEKASPSRRPSPVRRGAPIPVTVGFATDRPVGPSPSLALNRPRTGDLDRIRALGARRG